MSSRREFLIAAGVSSMVLSGVPAVAKNPVPRRRGFYFGAGYRRRRQSDAGPAALSFEDECRIIRDWGFDLVRIAMNYWEWVDYTDKTEHGGPFAKDLYKIKESGLAPIDEMVTTANKHGLHVLLDMHRAPGYNYRETVLGQLNEPFNLWTDEEAQQAFVFYWDMLAKRYRGVSTQDMSFDLVNEPQRFRAYTLGLTHASYAPIMAMAANKIWKTSPDRVVYANGMNRVVTADEVVPELFHSGLGQSTHAYAPLELTHYRTWIDVDKDFPLPGWPTKLRAPGDSWGALLAGSQEWPSGLRDSKGYFGPAQLRELYRPWGEMTRRGIPVINGEFGVSCHSPNDAAMRWYADLLGILKGYGIGWTYLSFRGRGPGGTDWGALLDSGRTDVSYEDFHGHRLNRQLLTLLQKS